MKYIDAEKLIAEIERRKKQDVTFRERSLLIDMENAINSLQQEQPDQPDQPDVDLDALVNEAFDKYSSVDGYGQLSVSLNRAELYSFIKKIARKEE